MEEDPIIRICRFILLSATAAFAIAGTAHAKRTDDGTKLLKRFVEARLADVGGQNDAALSIYQDSLKRQPDNALVAGKTYVGAIETGNWNLALKAVRSIGLSGDLEKEMPALLFSDAFRKQDWKSAQYALTQLEELGNFAFLAPMLENWITLAKSQKSDVSYDNLEKNRTARYYLDEQRVLLQLASGRIEGALKGLRDVVEQNDVRMSPVRMMAARHLLAQNQIGGAKEILKSRRTMAERRLLDIIEAGQSRSVAQEITPRVGAAYTFHRLSADLGSQRAPFLALVMAQIGSNIVGKNDFDQLVLGRAYSAANNGSKAREAYQKIESSSPYFVIARNAEIGSFIDDKKFRDALERIEGQIADKPTLPELHVLKGQIHQADKNHKDAAHAYQKAVSLAVEGQYRKPVIASYYLALGSAQEQAGLWPDGLESLKKANVLLPDSANILNYLGYAQLERRENAEEAIKAIRRAHELRSSSPAIKDSLGWAYFIIGEHETAVNYLEQALSGQPHDPTINEHLGDAYWTVGRRYEARYAWKTAKLFADVSDEDRLIAKIDLGLTPELISP